MCINYTVIIISAYYLSIQTRTSLHTQHGTIKNGKIPVITQSLYVSRSSSACETYITS